MADPVFKSKITAYVLLSWILAAFGGLMFGYDIGISGMSIRNVYFFFISVVFKLVFVSIFVNKFCCIYMRITVG